VTLRLDQWVPRPGSDRLELRLPAELVESLADEDQLEWVLLDGHEELELNGGEGSGYEELMSCYAARRRLPTSELIRALRLGYGQQLIWGELRAFERGGSEPVLTIAGFDSTWYDIEGRADLVGRIAAMFE
jgi:hypothetical protein